MNGKETLPENAKINKKYWLDKSGNAFQVDDHLISAQYAKADSDEYERMLPWSYDDMFRNGWVRVHTEPTKIWADGPLNNPQKRWLKEAKAYMEKEYDQKFPISSGRGHIEKILMEDTIDIVPTKKFITIWKKLMEHFKS